MQPCRFRNRPSPASARFVLVCFGLAAACVPGRARAQFTDPHSYDNGPVDVNQIELAYGYVRADSSLDTSLVVAGAKLTLQQGVIDYTRYLGIFKRMAWVEAAVPLAGLAGSVEGTSIQGSIAGTGDSSYNAGILLKGGPALSVADFDEYKPTTTFGVNLTVTAPTGLYNSDKILNLGSDRWSFKPEIALSHPFGQQQQWQLDTYANASMFTGNTSYRGKQILRQEALVGIEEHVSYSFTDWLWASLDTRYSFRGSTSVNGLGQDDAQQNFIVGSELNFSLNPQSSLTFEIAKVPVHRNGPTYTGFAVKYDYSWGKGYRRSGNKQPHATPK